MDTPSRTRPGWSSNPRAILDRCSKLVPNLIDHAVTLRYQRCRSNSIMKPMPPWIVCEVLQAATHLSLQNALAWDTSIDAGSDWSILHRASYVSNCPPSTHTIMSAQRCCIDWKDPIGRPNATRFFAYSIAISASLRVAPTICAQIRAVARSNISRAISQP